VIRKTVIFSCQQASLFHSNSGKRCVIQTTIGYFSCPVSKEMDEVSIELDARMGLEQAALPLLSFPQTDRHMCDSVGLTHSHSSQGTRLPFSKHCVWLRIHSLVIVVQSSYFLLTLPRRLWLFLSVHLAMFSRPVCPCNYPFVVIQAHVCLLLLFFLSRLGMFTEPQLIRKSNKKNIKKCRLFILIVQMLWHKCWEINIFLLSKVKQCMRQVN
jgi:hypothetical protein